MIRKEVLQEVIESQREWIKKHDIGIKREAVDNIKLSDSFARVISGVRRCGKSTLLAQMLKRNRFYYLNLEDPRLEGLELKDLTNVEKIFREYGEGGVFFFDEVQNIPNWEKFIRYLVDKKERVVITGSNASLLSRELGTRLTGRHLRTELFPFSYNEFLSFKKLKPSRASFEKYLERGGFPEFLKEEDTAVHHELLNDVVARDIAIRFGLRNIAVLKKMATYLLSQVGKKFSHNALKKTFQIKSVQSVIDYMSYFEDSYLLFTVPVFSYSYKKQQVNPKKVYSIDNGLSYSNSVSFSRDKGRMLENIVFLELRRKFGEIFYYAGEGECDFIVKDGKLQAIQVCYELNDENEKREINGLKEAMKELNIKEGVLLTLNQEDEIDGIKIKPVWKWLIERQRN